MAQNMHFKLEKPDIKDVKPEKIFEFLESKKTPEQEPEERIL